MPRIEHINENNIEKKYCGKCKKYNQLSDFGNSSTTWDNLRPTCKNCLKEFNLNNKEKRTEYNKKYWTETKEDQTIKHKKWVEENKEHVKEKMKEWLDNNKEYKKEKDKEYRINNWDKKKEYNREWKRKNYHDMKTNPERKNELARYKIKYNTARRIREMLGFKKSNKTMEYVGCSLEDFKIYLEKQFTKEMSWDNYGEDKNNDKKNAWQIDHIIPCDAFNFDNENEVKACFYFKNLRPLWASENIIKKNKFDKNTLDTYLNWYNTNVLNKKKVQQEIIDDDDVIKQEIIIDDEIKIINKKVKVQKEIIIEDVIKLNKKKVQQEIIINDVIKQEIIIDDEIKIINNKVKVKKEIITDNVIKQKAIIMDDDNKIINKKVEVQGKIKPTTREKLTLLSTKSATLLSPLPDFHTDPITIKCPNSHTWTTKIKNILRGHWCPTCGLQVEDKTKEKISTKFKAYLQTDEGKENKKISLQKRSETMKAIKQEKIATITEKQCTKCTTIKPIINYCKKSASADGYQSWCKPCNNTHKKLNNILI